MLTFLFWNVKGVATGGSALLPTDIRYNNLLAWLAQEVATSQNGNPVDVLVLAESPFRGQLALPGLRLANTLVTPNSKTGCLLEVYYREATIRLDMFGGVGRATVQNAVIKRSGLSLLVVAAHLESPQRQDREEDRKEAVRDLAGEIRFAEQQQGHSRTLVVGDLNYNPYDLPIYGAKYLHAVPTSELALQRQRTIKGREHPFFFNPMWTHFGDADTPAGTYYKRTSSVDCRFWHMPDQVLLRPDLLPYWQNNLRILTRVGSQSIVKAGSIPDAQKASDHLPLLFDLSL